MWFFKEVRHGLSKIGTLTQSKPRETSAGKKFSLTKVSLKKLDSKKVFEKKIGLEKCV